jgi:hypothetical protein
VQEEVSLRTKIFQTIFRTTISNDRKGVLQYI